jgi:hypothetical protein
MHSCNPCDNLDCLSDNYFGQFRIVNKVDGKDLVFGSTRIYDKNQIRFFSLNGADTINYEYTTIKFGGNDYDSILYVKFYPVSNTPVYIKLSTIDTDTLTVNYNTFNTKCCGTITEITTFRYNNSIDIPGNKGTKEIRK